MYTCNVNNNYTVDKREITNWWGMYRGGRDSTQHINKHVANGKHGTLISDYKNKYMAEENILIYEQLVYIQGPHMKM